MIETRLRWCLCPAYKRNIINGWCSLCLKFVLDPDEKRRFMPSADYEYRTTPARNERGNRRDYDYVKS